MAKTKSPLELGTKDIGKLLMQYAIPSIIAMTASSIYNITDSIFIGHGVGALAISGLAITFPIMNLSVAFGAMVGIGASTLLSVRLGQKDYDTANKILGNVIIMNTVVGIAFSIVALAFLDPILLFFGASDKTLPYAREFMHIILLGNVVTHMYLGLNAVLRSAGMPEKSMYATIFTVLINLVLNPLFIFGFHWGIKGSATATVISQLIVLIWQLKLFTSKDIFIKIDRKKIALNWKIVKESLTIGLAPFFMNAVACLIVIVINRELMAYGGDLSVGAFGIVNRISFLFLMVVFGLNQGMQPIAGYNFGAGHFKRVDEVLKKTIMGATLVMTLGFILVELFPHAVASIFTTDAELIQRSVRGLRVVFIFFPIVGFQIVTSAFFQSIGKPGKSIFMSMTRQLLFLLPGLIILPHFFGLSGVWMSMPLADLISSIIAAVMVYQQFKHFKKADNKLI